MDAASPLQYPVPLFVLTGFLGSGKTTLLNQMLQDPALARTAILVNEFGDVALDHLLVRAVSENIVLLNSGCLCCAVRGDLVDALRELFIQQLQGEIPPLHRVVIETTGLADPAPIIHTVLTDENLRERYRLAGVIVTIDAVIGLDQIERHEECLRQVVLADILVPTKQDLPGAAGQPLEDRLRALNPGARLLQRGAVARALLDTTPPERTLPAIARSWIADSTPRHDPRVQTFTLYRVRPLEWDRFLAWLTPILTAHGPRILRMKGLLNVAGMAEPVVIQGVQHIFYPATTLPEWPDGDRRSKLVFITLGLDEDAIRPSFQALLEQDRAAAL